MSTRSSDLDLEVRVIAMQIKQERLERKLREKVQLYGWECRLIEEAIQGVNNRSSTNNNSCNQRKTVTNHWQHKHSYDHHTTPLHQIE